jgi:hypothetical protein
MFLSLSHGDLLTLAMDLFLIIRADVLCRILLIDYSIYTLKAQGRRLGIAMGRVG